MKKRSAFALAIPLLLAFAPGDGLCQNVLTPDAQQRLQALMTEQQTLQEAEAHRAEIISAIEARWIDHAVSRGFSNWWYLELEGVLQALPVERLVLARQADSYENLLRVVEGRKPKAAMADGQSVLDATAPTGSVVVSSLGDDASDLVYFPVTPCRLIDTRLAGGKLTPGVTRNFVVNGSLTAQGGDAVGCGIPVDPAAVAITLTVTQINGPGNLRAWPYVGTLPNASVINYNVGDVANTTVVPICQLCGYDMNLRADVNGTHLVADVVGYFWSPLMTPLDVTSVVATATVAGGGGTYDLKPTCPAGRTLVSGGFNYTGGTGFNVEWWENGPFSPSTWSCRGANNSPNPINATCTAKCGATPGR